MDDGATASEGHDEAAHEVDGMIGGNDAEITRSRPKRKNGSYGHALLEIVFVREDAALGATAGAGRINDAGGIAAPALHKYWLARILKFFPAFCAAEIGMRGRVTYDYGADGESFEFVVLRDGAPRMIFSDENFRV